MRHCAPVWPIWLRKVAGKGRKPLARGSESCRGFATYRAGPRGPTVRERCGGLFFSTLLGYEVFMKCPIETQESGELLLAYCSRKLDSARTRILEDHIEICPACRQFADGQK